MKQLVFLLPLLCLAFSLNQHEYILNSLTEKLSNTLLGQQVVDLVELSLMKNSQVDQIQTMLDDILKELRSDQNSETQEDTKKLISWSDNIKNLENTMAILTGENDLTSSLLNELSSDVESLSSTINSLKKQLDILNKREEEIRSARFNEEAAFKKRSQSNTKVLQAMKEIRDRLANAIFDQQKKSLIEIEERTNLVNKVKEELGDQHPIFQLIELTATFDETAVKIIIEKLENLQKAIEKSQEVDSQNEEIAKQTFDAMVSEIDKVRNQMSSDYQTSQNQIKIKQLNLIVTERKKNEVSEDLETTRKILIANKSQRDLFESEQKVKSEKRLGQIQAVEEAIEVIMRYAEKQKGA